ncbi:D-cysteine desulfhydrase family protein [Thalassobacter stenotrophicus]|uniref:D-cysteine desulfhydrase n=2 Tax=Thalassobacter stenotrophicus TaxID=266809 RepID=A0A0P1EZT5_9RHOB|nr:D-cysteine desulfhydrase family protein [Thalassobacter stenotrophicus]UYP69664.1 D-cysteine desulfhydrase family protein [Thalassobacter stenotrophicus]CUH60621.1 D-cysteine desulfhydrase [Thalassobacter stenotrophicus]SHJ37177.1 D-cysteine desulfhydrase [Thalassobacter stenotrophicus DSM 16310]
MVEFPQAGFVPNPTPIERLDRLSDALGVDLWVKRDDLAGPSFGGNKTRQLDFYLGAALAQECDTILITGAVQSNFVRTAAALAAKLGMRTIVQLEARVPVQDELYQSSGNVLLNQLLGAEVILYPEGEDEAGADAALRARAEEERAKGSRPYVIPLALGNPPLGALGYVDAAKEIIDQKSDFDFVAVASGSGLTHAGLLSGFHARGFAGRVVGSCVRRDAVQQRVRIRTVLDDIEALTPATKHVPSELISIWDGALDPGYGQIGPAAFSAMTMMGQNEGLVLDPVYTAKVFAAIPALVGSGEIAKGSRVLFVHTGGLASFFAYQTDLKRMLGVD